MPLKFIKTQRGGLMLLHDGYLYNKKSLNKTDITWRCIEYRKRLCNIIIHTTSDKRTGEVIGTPLSHDHAANIVGIETLKVKEKLKKKARKDCAMNGVLIANVLSNVPSPIRAQLPKMTSLTRTVQRAKKTDGTVVVNPKTLRELIIPNIYQVTNDGEVFLLHDSGGGSKRFLIYSTAKNLEVLAQCHLWCCDGTFNSVPVIFKQMYTIHGMYHDKLLPLVYILAPNKSEKLYTSVLSVIRRYQPNLEPRRIIIDFERAFINAVESQFAACTVSGCFFHFCQCVWRHVQSSGLQHYYNTNLNFCLNIKMLMALAFVPVDHVIEAYEELIGSQFYEDNEDLFRNLIYYFESTWIGERCCTGRKRKNPKFNLSLWNCYQATLDDVMRSNNGVESWHHSFNGKVRVSHAIFSSFINVIKAEQVLTATTISQIETGMNIVAKKRQKYADKDERIKNIVTEYDVHRTLKYLKNIAAALRVM